MLDIREVIIKSVSIYGVIYLIQIMKYLLIGKVNPTVLDLIVSIIVGLILSNKVMKLFN